MEAEQFLKQLEECSLVEIDELKEMLVSHLMDVCIKKSAAERNDESPQETLIKKYDEQFSIVFEIDRELKLMSAHERCTKGLQQIKVLVKMYLELRD